MPATARIENGAGGIAGEIDGERWRIGSPEFAFDESAPDAEALEAIEKARAAGLLPAVLSDGRGRGAVFSLAERWREDAGEIAVALKGHGIRHLVLLSGDAPARTARIGREIGFDEAHGGMSAGEKLAWVEQRERAGESVVFIGDGWNDAPALSAAAVSVTFAEAPELPRSTSDFLLLGRRLLALVEARAIARRARGVLAQNVLWALAYNVLAVPLAAAGRVPPWAASLGMSASSLLVVANALRMGRNRRTLAGGTGGRSGDSV